MDDIASHFDNVYFAPRDAIFSLTYDYENNPSPKKIDISVGAYRDENVSYMDNMIKKFLIFFL